MGVNILVLCLAYFTVSNVRDSLLSICKQNGPDISSIDIEIFEMPSVNSDEMRIMIADVMLKCGHQAQNSLRSAMSPVARVKDHYTVDYNVEGIIFEIQMILNPQYYTKYDIIAITDTDAVLENGAIQEAVNILQRLPEAFACAVDTNMSASQVPPVLPFMRKWKLPGKNMGFYIKGPISFQFTLFRSADLKSFFTALKKREIVGLIALGDWDYHHISDSNLNKFAGRLNRTTVRTKYHALNHIGWQNYINTTSNDYVQTRGKNKLFRRKKTLLQNVTLCSTNPNLGSQKPCILFDEPCFFAAKLDCLDSKNKQIK